MITLMLIINKSARAIKEPDFEITKPKDGFYTKLMPATTRRIQREWAVDKLDIFKKDQASNFLYPKRFAYADTDAVSWKSHITREVEPHLPEHYGIGSIKKAQE